MAKVKGSLGNDFCPQALFLYGTEKEDGTPNFGLFCWFSYAWMEHEGRSFLGVMACIGEDKLTKDRIRANGVFSANLVTEPLLPLADYYGNTCGRENADKMKFMPTVEKSEVLGVLTIAESPVSYELRVLSEQHLAEGSDLFLCEICNVMIEEDLNDEGKPFYDRLRAAAPVITAGNETYESIGGGYLGKWGEPMLKLKQ